VFNHVLAVDVSEKFCPNKLLQRVRKLGSVFAADLQNPMVGEGTFIVPCPAVLPPEV
jgi:hypothetical protein